MPLLVATGIRRSFYGVRALDGAEVAVEPGTVTGLIGPNGAGKTTFFNCISGMIPPDGGRVVFDGQDVTGWSPDRITRRGMVRTFQIARGFPRLTVMENLLLYGPDQPGEAALTALFGRRAAKRREDELVERAKGIAAQLRLTRVLDNRAAEVSGGQKKLLEIGRALMAEPRLVLLDEPVAGVNPTLAGEIVEIIRGLRDKGLTFLVVEHDMEAVSRLCDPVVVFAEGRRLTQGTFAEVAADPRVQESYMGRRAWAS
jgi:branched-chain amino acid transport system ATP-binding protein/neutral amino acid transport system ATP-binding protein